jgi:hypothetical protein
VIYSLCNSYSIVCFHMDGRRHYVSLYVSLGFQYIENFDFDLRGALQDLKDLCNSFFRENFMEGYTLLN